MKTTQGEFDTKSYTGNLLARGGAKLVWDGGRLALLLESLGYATNSAIDTGGKIYEMGLNITPQNFLIVFKRDLQIILNYLQ